MSDIPVGSPPAPPGRHAAPGGWYPDPLDLTRERYWDGWQWSRTTRPSEAGATPSYAAAHPGASPTFPAYAAAPGAAYRPGSVRSRQADRTADGVPLAGWWWRALAGLVDALLVGTVTALLTLPFYRGLFDAVATYWGEAMRAAQSGGMPPPTPSFVGTVTGTDQLMVTLIALAIGLAYHVPFLRARGATLGLLACGLRVVPLDEGRSTARLAWSRVLVRAALWVLPGALGFRILTVADVLVPVWHPRRQTLHDLAAQTQVVRLR